MIYIESVGKMICPNCEIKDEIIKDLSEGCQFLLTEFSTIHNIGRDADHYSEDPKKCLICQNIFKIQAAIANVKKG